MSTQTSAQVLAMWHAVSDGARLVINMATREAIEAATRPLVDGDSWESIRGGTWTAAWRASWEIPVRTKRSSDQAVDAAIRREP